mgnify:CR=1 FL=1
MINIFKRFVDSIENIFENTLYFTKNKRCCIRSGLIGFALGVIVAWIF